MQTLPAISLGWLHANESKTGSPKVLIISYSLVSTSVFLIFTYRLQYSLIKMSVLWHFSLPWSEYTFREYLILILTLILIFRASGSDAEGCSWQADSSATQSTTLFPTALLGRLTNTAGKENCRHSKLPIASKMQIHLNILLNIILLLIFWVLIVPIILFWISLRI